MIHLIIGDGKGKTSASVGMAMRSAGHGWSVLFIQFLKGDSSGEINAIKSIPNVTVMHSQVNYGFVYQMTKEQLEETTEECERLMHIAITSNAKLVILDEVIHAYNAGMINRTQIEKILEKNVEIVLTGEDAPDWLLDKADYVSRVAKIKHPYDKGIKAREGIEF